MTTEAYVEKCIFGVFPPFSSLLNPSLQLSRMQVLKIDTQKYIVYEEQITYTDVDVDASEEKTRERGNPDTHSGHGKHDPLCGLPTASPLPTSFFQG
jgi:hypothetical protein